MLVVGLGNPEYKYFGTRHNVGRDFIDHMAGSSTAQITYLQLPCFMNESGPALGRYMQKKGVKPSDLLIIVDEFMIPFGTLRFGQKGSSGGHNGMKSIIQTLGTEEFARLRVGIGPVPEGQDPADFVLKKFTKPEASAMPQLFEAIKKGIETYAQAGFEKAATASNKNHL